MVVDGGMGKSLREKLCLPGQHITAKTGREAIMTVGLSKEVLEAGEMQSNFLRDCFRAHADDR